MACGIVKMNLRSMRMNKNQFRHKIYSLCNIPNNDNEINVLLSIKPKYVAEILKDNKKFEFRKRFFNEIPKRIFIYSSAPDKKIVGYFKYTKAICDTPEELWSRCNKRSGINMEEFFTYFKSSEKGFAIVISGLNKIAPINPKELLTDFIPPQSYLYF